MPAKILTACEAIIFWQSKRRGLTRPDFTWMPPEGMKVRPQPGKVGQETPSKEVLRLLIEGVKLLAAGISFVIDCLLPIPEAKILRFESV